MKIFMTGATGFIGTATAKHLAGQGHSLTCLVRDRSRATELERLECKLVTGDLATSRAEMATMMAGHDALIHGAAIYEVGIPSSRIAALREANVEGTAAVLEASLDAAIPRVLYLSTCAVFGNTEGVAVTEDYVRPDLSRPDGPKFTSVYEETKFEAHQIALELIRKRDLPCVIAQPAGVYGPGDHSAIAATIKQFIEGKLPLLPFPDFGSGMAHVDDTAIGLGLALEKGEIGESYILTAENLTMREIVATAARITGRKAPSRAMPTGLLKLLRPVGPLVGKLMGQPPNLAELISSADGVTFWADATRAREELGFSPRDFETGLRQTLEAEGKM